MRRIAVPLLALAIVVGGCGAATTTVSVVVAEHALETEGLVIGAPLAGGTVRVYSDDDVVYSVILEASGTAELTVEPGVYTVQVELASDEHCFWGETLFEVALPAGSLELAASYICAGG